MIVLIWEVARDKNKKNSRNGGESCNIQKGVYVLFSVLVILRPIWLFKC